MTKSKLSAEKFLQLKRGYFKSYPKHEELYFTNDGFCFLSETAAKNHASTAKVKCELVKKSDVQIKQPAKKTAKEWNAELLAFELSEDCNWDTIQALGEAFEIKSRSRQGYIDGLLPIQERLKEEGK